MGNLYSLYIHASNKMGLFRFIGILLVSATLVYFGYNMYINDSVKADCNRRLQTLWNEAAAKQPALAQHNALFSQYSKYILQFMMFSLLSAPALVFCRWCALWVLPAYALWVALFYNPYVQFSGADGKAVTMPTFAVALKSWAVLGGLLWYLCHK